MTRLSWIRRATASLLGAGAYVTVTASLFASEAEVQSAVHAANNVGTKRAGASGKRRKWAGALIVGGPASGKHTLCDALSEDTSATSHFFFPGTIKRTVGSAVDKHPARWQVYPSLQLVHLIGRDSDADSEVSATESQHADDFTRDTETDAQVGVEDERAARINFLDLDAETLGSAQDQVSDILEQRVPCSQDGWVIALDLADGELQDGDLEALFRRSPFAPRGLEPELVVVLRCKKDVMDSRMQSRRIRRTTGRRYHELFDADTLEKVSDDNDYVSMDDDREASSRWRKIETYAQNLPKFLEYLRHNQCRFGRLSASVWPSFPQNACSVVVVSERQCNVIVVEANVAADVVLDRIQTILQARLVSCLSCLFLPVCCVVGCHANLRTL